MVYLQTFDTVEDYEAVKDTLPENCVVTIKGNNGAVFKADNMKPSVISTSNLKTINGESLIGEGDIVIEGGSGNGLQYALERTVYPTRMEMEGREATNYNLTGEERDYNKSTYEMAWEDETNIFISMNGAFFSTASVDADKAVFNKIYHIDAQDGRDGFYSNSITVTKNGDATVVVKKIEIGGNATIDPEMLEGVMKHSRDFSSDFNNDF